MTACLWQGCTKQPVASNASEYASAGEEMGTVTTGTKGDTFSGIGVEDKTELASSYVVRRGDNLWKIARRKQIYSNPWLWVVIFRANLGIIKIPDQVEKGMALRIPRNLSPAEMEAAKEDAMAGDLFGHGSTLPDYSMAARNSLVSQATPVKKGSRTFWILLLLLLAAIAAAYYVYRKRSAPVEAS
jgi:hypothetical protein